MHKNINEEELRRFLVDAKKSTYAAGDNAAKVKNDDKSTTIVFEQGDWKYHDNYFGGEPYGGREVVFYKGQPVYFMAYYGRVHGSAVDVKEIYAFLMAALRKIPLDAPYRGPKFFTDGQLTYSNTYSGTLDDFAGEEQITKDGVLLFSTKYAGGSVDE